MVPGMSKPPGGCQVTIAVNRDGAQLRGAAGFGVAAERAAAGRGVSIMPAHTAEEIIAVIAVETAGGRAAFSVALAVVSARRSGIWPGAPSGERLVPEVMRGFVVDGLPVVLVAAAALHPDVPEASAAFGPLAGGLADTRCPGHLSPARPQHMTVRACFGLVLEK